MSDETITVELTVEEARKLYFHSSDPATERKMAEALDKHDEAERRRDECLPWARGRRIRDGAPLLCFPGRDNVEFPTEAARDLALQAPDLRQERDELRGRVRELERYAATADEDRDAYRESWQERSRRVEALEAQIDRMHHHAEEVAEGRQRLVQELEAECAEWANAVARLRQELNAKDRELRMLRDLRDGLAADGVKLRERAEKAEQERDRRIEEGTG